MVAIDLDVLNNFLMYLLIVGAIDAPYSMGIFETIVAVHFEGGLAVEFFNGSK